MKMMLYGILIALSLLVPTRPLELGKLKPVELIRIDKTGDRILIETDTGVWGQGKTVNQAIRDLQDTTAGTVYLDTAEYVLLPEDENLLHQMEPYLRGIVVLCRWEGEIKLDEAAKYLDAHKPETKLKAYQSGMQLETLTGENGRLHLEK